MCQFSGDLRGLLRHAFDLGRAFERSEFGSLDVNAERLAILESENVVVLSRYRNRDKKEA